MTFIRPSRRPPELDGIPAEGANRGRFGRLPLAVAIVLIAFNLRPALSSLAPVLNEVMADTGLSAAGASLMTMAPVLCLGVFAAAAPALLRAMGVERALLLALGGVLIGSALRALGSVTALATGSLLAGAGIGVGNVLLPGLLKRDFADRAPLMTGIYSMALCAGAAIAAGATAPLRDAAGGNWRVALAFWAVPATVALLISGVIWRPRLRRPTHMTVRLARGAGLWRDALAWQVTLFMGLQSMLAYTIFGWLAPILRGRGDSAVTAGLVVSLCVVAQVVASLPAPILAARRRSQSWPALVSMVATVSGFVGMLYAPLGWQWACAVLSGLGMGGAFALAVMFMVLRAPNGASSAALSSMSQAVGYTLAAFGPLAVGVLHDRTGDWSGALGVFLVAGGLAAVAGFCAGRDRVVRG